MTVVKNEGTKICSRRGHWDTCMQNQKLANLLQWMTSWNLYWVIRTGWWTQAFCNSCDRLILCAGSLAKSFLITSRHGGDTAKGGWSWHLQKKGENHLIDALRLRKETKKTAGFQKYQKSDVTSTRLFLVFTLESPRRRRRGSRSKLARRAECRVTTSPTRGLKKKLGKWR